LTKRPTQPAVHRVVPDSNDQRQNRQSHRASKGAIEGWRLPIGPGNLPGRRRKRMMACSSSARQAVEHGNVHARLPVPVRLPADTGRAAMPIAVYQAAGPGRRPTFPPWWVVLPPRRSAAIRTTQRLDDHVVGRLVAPTVPSGRTPDTPRRRFRRGFFPGSGRRSPGRGCPGCRGRKFSTRMSAGRGPGPSSMFPVAGGFQVSGAMLFPCRG